MRFPASTPTFGAVLLALAVAGPVSAQGQKPRVPDQQPSPRRESDSTPRRDSDSAPRAFAWWKSEPFKKELGLTAEQSGHLDKIWETTRPELRQEWDELSRLEGKLSKLIQSDADEATLSRQIDRVETARANVNKTRALMLVQMRKVLTPEQRLKFDAIHDRWQDRSRQPDRGQQDRGQQGARPSAAPPASSSSTDAHPGRP